MVKPFAVIQAFIDRQNAIADFIANGEDEGIRGHIRQQYRNRCDEFANLPGWARALASGSANTMNRICKPYYDQGGFDGPVLTQPFTGGQCRKRYNVSFSGNTVASCANPTPIPFSQNTQLWGPISGVSLTGNACSPTAPVQGAGKVTFQSFSLIGGPDRGVPTTSQTALTATSVSINSVSVINGTPDDCGDPPSFLEPGPNPPPNPGPLPGPEPRDDPDGGPIPELPIPPYEDPIFGPIPIDPGDDSGDGGDRTPSGGDGLPGAGDSVGPAAGTATGGEDGEDVDFGPPPDGTVWVGALIEITADPRFGNIPGTGPANTVYPTVLGNASLRYQGGRGRSSRLQSKWSDLVRPVTSLVVLGVYVHCLPGVVATVYPINAIICPEDPCGEN